MRITLQTVRDTVRPVFGRDSFVASFVSAVEPDDSVPTACIDARGRMRYGPAFAQKHLAGQEELFCLVVHELMHPLFAHFVHGGGRLENFAGDIVINAMITAAYAEPARDGCLFRRCYAPRGAEGLLRPGSAMADSRFERLYALFYGNGGGLSTGETVAALRTLLDAEPGAVLLGGHGPPAERWPRDVLGRVAGDLRGAAREPGRYGGRGRALYAMLAELLRTHLPLRRRLLERFATDRKADGFRCPERKHAACASPVPVHPSKRDLVLLAAGVPPLHYRCRAERPGSRSRGLAVYLDVSGSVQEHLPRILAALGTFRRDLQTVMLFSNEVVETDFARVLRGRLETTYGTDFDCVARHILEKGYDKAVVFTDGFADLDGALADALRERGVRTLTVLFGDGADCEEFAATGPVVELAELLPRN